MKRSSRPELEEFKHELKDYQSIAQEHRYWSAEESLLSKQLSFWLESARFLVSELEIWDRLGNSKKYDETIKRLQKALNNVYRLITQLLEKDGQ